MNKIYVVGIGPGGYDQMTIRAAKVIESCDVIIGYTVYIDLVKDHFPDKKMLSTPMRREEERCRLAFDEAAKGQSVAMICSGDAGVYGMSGLMYEVGQDYADVELEIVSGVTAALSGGAVLGAPLMHDFSVISLSDLMTPWELIEKRLEAAAMADMVICLYNPSSKKRHDYLHKACHILMRHAKPETVCGIVKEIGREGQSYEIMSLRELADYQADMFTTVFIGNSSSREIDGHMVTPRGYQLKRQS